jgi:hypothetical protein
MNKLELIPIHVECHSGHRADEYPKTFGWQYERHETTDITDTVALDFSHICWIVVTMYRLTIIDMENTCFMILGLR